MMCQVSCPFSYSPGLQKYAPTGIASVPFLLARANSSSLFVLRMCLEGSGRLLPPGTLVGRLCPSQEMRGGVLGMQAGGGISGGETLAIVEFSLAQPHLFHALYLEVSTLPPL